MTCPITGDRVEDPKIEKRKLIQENTCPRLKKLLAKLTETSVESRVFIIQNEIDPIGEHHK